MTHPSRHARHLPCKGRQDRGLAFRLVLRHPDGRGCGKSIVDIVAYVFEVLVYVVVVVAYNRYSERVEFLSANPVFFFRCRLVMFRTIDFYGDSFFGAIKINDVLGNNVLSAYSPRQGFQTSVPKSSFLRCHCFAKISRNRFQFRIVEIVFVFSVLHITFFYSPRIGEFNL